MKQYLISEKGNFYKINLHMHTTCSDGKMTPEETKAYYKAHGYSAVAFSDHDVMIDHSDLNDSDFLALTAYEVYSNDIETDSQTSSEWKSYHLNFFASKPDEKDYACPNPEYCFGNAKNLVQDYYVGDYKRIPTVEGQNEMIAEARKKGYLVSYNHPMWSLHHYPDYAGLEGLNAVEVYNGGCVVEGFSLDGGDHVYHDMLCLGKRVYPFATDDAHKIEQCCQGWTWVKAEDLTYDSIFGSLSKGELYASWGPELKELWAEDGIIHIKCNEVKEIYLVTECRFARRKKACEGELLTEAEFDLRWYFSMVNKGNRNSKAFFRIVLVDADGNRAMTRGYFADELTGESRGL